MSEDPYDAGMKVRREVLGDEHVDRAIAAATDLTAPFQEFITRYAWGEIWSRPGLDLRTRSCITVVAAIRHCAGGGVDLGLSGLAWNLAGIPFSQYWNIVG